MTPEQLRQLENISSTMKRLERSMIADAKMLDYLRNQVEDIRLANLPARQPETTVPQ